MHAHRDESARRAVIRAGEQSERRPPCTGVAGPPPAGLRQAREDVAELPYGTLVVVLGGDRLVQVLGAAADQACAVAVRQSGEGGDRPAACLFAVAVVIGAGRGVHV